MDYNNLRIGTGFDIHPFKTGKELIVGGVKIPFAKGLAGHSDADVLIHSIIDAILGAMGQNDIGCHFPDCDPSYKNISSILLLEKTISIMRDNGYIIINLDSIIIAEEPKFSPYFLQMKNLLSKAMKIETSKINIKAKTTEKLGALGRSEGIAANTSILLYKTKENEK